MEEVFLRKLGQVMGIVPWGFFFGLKGVAVQAIGFIIVFLT